MTVRELLQNGDIQLDDELYISVPYYNEINQEYTQNFHITDSLWVPGRICLFSENLSKEHLKKKIVKDY